MSYRISALVSVYQAERFLRGCLDDLEAQTIASDLEIIVVDSGSPENEREIVREYQRRYGNIRYLRSEERISLYQAWNRGVDLSEAMFLTTANADDRHRPDALEVMVAALERNPDAAVAYADVAITTKENQPFGSAPEGFMLWPDYDPVALFRSCFIGPQPVWRRSLHGPYGRFDETFVSAGDYEFWLRMHAERFIHIPQILGLYLYSLGGIENQNLRRSREEAEIARERHWKAEWGRRPRPAGNCIRWNGLFYARQMLRGRILPIPGRGWT